ncbi:hypothetical protein L6V77_16885 [Myxococcota bacterium]|nr:hypothetical protein [Myxococcota bacterium]
MTPKDQPCTLDLMVGDIPKGARLLRGVCVTHDCDDFAVCDHLLPALMPKVGAKPEGRGERRKALIASTMHPATFTVISARLPNNTVGPVMPDWLQRLSVGGRRLHAKFGIFEFETADKDRHIRAYVTSANLTMGGLFRNRELVYAQTGTSKAPPGLAITLLAALGALGESIKSDPAEEGAVTRSMRAIESMTPVDWAKWARPDGEGDVNLVHSLDASRDLIKEAMGGIGRKRATHVTVISPPFGASGNQAAAESVLRFAATKATVEVISSRAESGAVVFPVGVFANATQSVAFGSTAPEEIVTRSGRSEGRSRMLHAKLYAFRWNDGSSDILIGSANFTQSALGGGEQRGRRESNREMLVRLTMPTEEERAFLDAWKSANGFESSARLVAPPASAEFEGILPAPNVFAAFHPQSGAYGTSDAFTGDLELEYDEPPTAIEYQGRTVEGVQNVYHGFTLLAADCELFVTHPETGRRAIKIDFHPPAGDTEFFTRRATRPDPEANALLDWLRRRKRTATGEEGPSPQKGKGSRTEKTDRLVFPQADGLPALARLLRDRLIGPDDLDEETVSMLKSETLKRTRKEEEKAVQAVFDTFVASLRPGKMRRKSGQHDLLSHFSSLVGALAAREEEA